MTQLQVDDLSFAVRHSPRRKTLQITVDRNGSLVLAAPKGTDEQTLRDFVKEKRYWIYTKQAEKAQLQRRIPRKEYIDGEGFLHLGRSYRLKLVDHQVEPLKLAGGRFQLRRDKVSQGREEFIRWYTTHAQQWLQTKVSEHATRLMLNPSGVQVKDLGYRWGSCGKNNRLYFHWKSILLPRDIAEYVVVHELVHLKEAHHTPQFWKSLERAMPDFERRKDWLARHGIEVEGL